MVVSHHVVAGNWAQDLCSLWPKDLFTIIYKYTVVVFRHTRKECQIWLRVVVSRHVVAGFELRTFGRAIGDLYRWAISPSLSSSLLLFCSYCHIHCLTIYFLTGCYFHQVDFKWYLIYFIGFLKHDAAFCDL